MKLTLKTSSLFLLVLLLLSPTAFALAQAPTEVGTEKPETVTAPIPPELVEEWGLGETEGVSSASGGGVANNGYLTEEEQGRNLPMEVVATVNIHNATHTKTDRGEYNISFDISNRTGVQPEVLYGVQLVQIEDDGSRKLIDDHIVESGITLRENERFQASSAQASIATALFGTSMSAHLILGLEQVPRVWLFAN